MIMVDRILGSESVTHVCTGHSVSLQERRVVRTRAQSANMGLGREGLIGFTHQPLDIPVKASPIASILHRPQRSSLIGGMFDLHRSVSHQRSQRRRRAELQIAAGNRDVNVQVRDDVLAEPISKVFTPLGRADQTILFGVPAGNDNRSHRFPSLVQQCRKATHDFVDADGSTAGIRASEDPGVSMVSDNDDLVLDVTRNSRENVPDGGHLGIDLVNEADLFLGGAGVVFYITEASGPVTTLTDISRERALAFERLEQGQSIGVRDG